MRIVPTARARDVLRSTFWVIPMLCVVGSILLAVGLIEIDHVLGNSSAFFLYPGPPSGARSFLSSITQAMISFTGLVFSITIVALQLTSGQFSSRVTRTFLRDRVIQWSLGVFIATFVYAMTVQRAVRGTTGHEAFVPQVAVTIAFGFVLASVVMFIAYISHIANMLRVANIVAAIGDESNELLAKRYPADQPLGAPGPRLGPAYETVPAPKGAVVVSVNESALVRRACEAGLIVALVPRVGDYVATGSPLLSIYLDGSDRDEDKAPPGGTALIGEIAFDRERTMEQDLAFGFRQLVDIAQRGLSPGINDITTATQAIDVLHDLLRQLATRHLRTGCFPDDDGQLRLVVPQYSFADFLAVAVGEIWRYGSDAAQIPGRVAQMLDDLAAAALPEHSSAIRSWAAHVGEARHQNPGDPGGGPSTSARDHA